ncbi:sulfatase-like hydrolase/transferase [Flammeovirga sp. OC4]|uniref:sulfatase-like hydrolase/transferase n=1 Tax=Flammeovirga sp. OC4 TaxID=1382345 RepID=UPI0005C51929|nr:sulfatase-like hydrolase/transferase [Flammeovirga sp. OC4]
MNNIKITILVLMAFFSTTKTIYAQKQPNILWVITDDQRYDAISAFNKIIHGQKNSKLGYVESPNVDKLAKMGVTYINTYCQAQGCAPSRASMHLGRYPFRSGIYQFEYFNKSTDNSYPLLPETMAKLGYQTMHTGKLGVRVRKLKNGKALKQDLYTTDIDARLFSDERLSEWGKIYKLTEVEGQKLKNPVKQVAYLRDENGKIYYISKQLEEENPQFAGMAQEAYDKFDLMYKHNNKMGQPETVFSKGILAGVSPQPAGKTRDGLYTTAFIDFLKNENKTFSVGSKTFDGADTSKPIFCNLGYDFPHTPVLPPVEYRERFKKHSYKVPELTDEEYRKLAKAFKKRVNKSYSNDFTDEEKQKMIQDYYAFCAYGDALIGKATKAFIEYSEKHDRPWLILFVCGDHGWKLNEHGSIAKNTPWEMDAHNPIIVVSSDKKKFPKGKVVSDFTEFVDIAPTLITAGGGNVKDKEFHYLDGLDLQQVASGEAPVRDYVIGESHHAIGPRAYIRTKDYIFSVKTRPHSKRGVDMEWATTASYKELDPALYHTSVDPDETNNLAFDKKYEKIAKQMQKKLIDIVIGDGRAEINWGGDNYGKNVKAIGTEVHRSNYAPGAHDYKLDVQ